MTASRDFHARGGVAVLAVHQFLEEAICWDSWHWVRGEKMGRHYSTEQTGTEQFCHIISRKGSGTDSRLRMLRAQAQSKFDTSPPSVFRFVASTSWGDVCTSFPKLHLPLPISEIAGILRAPPEEKLTESRRDLHLQLCQQPCPQRLFTLYILPYNLKYLSKSALEKLPDDGIKLHHKYTHAFSINIYTDDWRCDQYRWVNNAVRKLPKREPAIKKTYFQADTPNGACNEFVNTHTNSFPQMAMCLSTTLEVDSPKETASTTWTGNTLAPAHQYSRA